MGYSLSSWGRHGANARNINVWKSHGKGSTMGAPYDRFMEDSTLKSHGSSTIVWQSHGRPARYLQREGTREPHKGFPSGHYRPLGQHPQPVSGPWDSQRRPSGVPWGSHPVNATTHMAQTYAQTHRELHGSPMGCQSGPAR